MLSATFLDPGGVTLIKDFLARNGQPQAIGGRYFINGVDTRTQGVDLDVHYAMKTANAGKVTLNFGANHNTTKVTRAIETPTALQALTLIPLFDVTEKTRMEKGQPYAEQYIGLSKKEESRKVVAKGLASTCQFLRSTSLAWPANVLV